MFLSRPLVRAAICLSVILSPALARAEEPLALSLPDVLERAASRAPEVVMATHAVREARARRTGAGIVVPVNPRMYVDARPPLKGGGTFPADLGYSGSLEVLFDVGGAPSARVREANRAAEVAEADLGTDRLRARSAAWAAYIRARIAETRIEETTKLIAAAERILSASKQRANAARRATSRRRSRRAISPSSALRSRTRDASASRASPSSATSSISRPPSRSRSRRRSAIRRRPSPSRSSSPAR